MREQVQRENYRIGDRIIAYCVDIEKNARGPQIVLSRASKGLLENCSSKKSAKFTKNRPHRVVGA